MGHHKPSNMLEEILKHGIFNETEYKSMRYLGHFSRLVSVSYALCARGEKIKLVSDCVLSAAATKNYIYSLLSINFNILYNYMYSITKCYQLISGVSLFCEQAYRIPLCPLNILYNYKYSITKCYQLISMVSLFCEQANRIPLCPLNILYNYIQYY